VPRPVILGVVGDSAAGKTTVTRGLVRVLGAESITHFCTDDYHRFDRRQRLELGVTPLHPDANYVDILSQHLRHIRRGEPILKPVYRHTDGTFGPPVVIRPGTFAVAEGLLGYLTAEMREQYDVRVFLKPPESMRRKWKVARDTARRGYHTSEVLDELDRREVDSETFIRPQERWADIVVAFSADGDDEHHDAELVLRPTLAHPDLTPFVDGERGITLTEVGRDCHVRIPGDIDPARAAAIEEAIWEKMRFASHLRSERLGEFSAGTELRRSESLALVQLLILYHLVSAKASVALGGDGVRFSAAELAAAE
jgi:phosphoribulokinase